VPPTNYKLLGQKKKNISVRKRSDRTRQPRGEPNFPSNRGSKKHGDPPFESVTGRIEDRVSFPGKSLEKRGVRKITHLKKNSFRGKNREIGKIAFQEGKTAEHGGNSPEEKERRSPKGVAIHIILLKKGKTGGKKAGEGEGKNDIRERGIKSPPRKGGISTLRGRLRNTQNPIFRGGQLYSCREANCSPFARGNKPRHLREATGSREGEASSVMREGLNKTEEPKRHFTLPHKVGRLQLREEHNLLPPKAPSYSEGKENNYGS